MSSCNLFPTCASPAPRLLRVYFSSSRTTCPYAPRHDIRPEGCRSARQGCPKCGSRDLDPTLHDPADCINREDHVQMICNNTNCLKEWSAKIA